jgi:aminopeptidase YwaD
MKRLLFFALLPICTLLSCSKGIDNVKRVVAELTKPEYYGRSAPMGGGIKAAKFIKDEFEKVGLKPIGKDYFQYFSYRANILTDSIIVNVDGARLEPGVDFTIANNTKSINEEFPLFYISNENLSNNEYIKSLSGKDLSKSIIVIDDDYVRNCSLDLYSSMALIRKLRVAGRISLHEYRPKYFGVANSRLNSMVILMVLKSNFPVNGKTLSINCKSTFIDNNPSMNVIGRFYGTSVPDSFIVICGHYDHLGMMGSQTFFPGADDNASAIGVMVDLANKYTSKKEESKYSIVFIAFGAEEAGLIGSRYFVENPLIPLDRIKIVLDLDMVGFGKEGLNIWNATNYPDVCQKFDEINKNGKYFSSITYKGEIPESDHHPFYLKGVKAIFITTGTEQSPNYHTSFDTFSSLTFDKINELENLLTGFISN